MKIAFYKGKGDWSDKIIRFVTRSPYSHCELVSDGIWYSTSPRDLRVRAKEIVPNPLSWDYVEVKGNKARVITLYLETKGAKYDWLGIIFAQLLPFGLHSKKRWFCSEWCAAALELKEPHKYSPALLYKYLVASNPELGNLSAHTLV